jgi:predicted short-subunit dehydrogenase-like oxidoreductase (DUF2520 family)
MDIIVIGSGNVATAMGRKMLSAGHRILQVYSRNRAEATHLAGLLQADPIGSLREMDGRAGLVLVSVSDTAYPAVVREIPFTRSLMVHTAGSVPMEVLKGSSPRFGVLYPLQSLLKTLPVQTDLPLLIDANSPESLSYLGAFAGTLSHTVVQAGDEARLKYHLGAVMVNNFSNHLYALTDAWCRQEGISFSLLHPLILETASRLAYASPGQLQTGPAIRNDEQTLGKHLQLLEDRPDLYRLYEWFTQSIRRWKHGTAR